MNEYNVQLAALSEKDLDRAYLSFKDALYDVSLAAFGWDETSQHERFIKAYDPEWFYWIEHQSKKVGYICFETRKSDIHIHLLIIFKEFQSAGHGKDVMTLIEDIAKADHLDITLSTLKNNVGAVKFYKRLGYEIVAQDEYFYELLFKTTNS